MASRLRISLLLLVSACTALAANFNVVVNGTASHKIPSTLYGLMYEDISHSGDGGLYAELLQNRAFQQVTPNTTAALNAWSAINGASITVVSNTAPLSSALPNSLQLTVPSGASGAVGVQNSGYFGINVNASWTYNASFHYKLPAGSTFKGPFTVALKSSSGQTFASASIPVTAQPNVWTQVSVPLKPTTSVSATNNVFTVTVDGAAASGQTIFFSLFSLFPPTFKNRPNGMRIDISETLLAIGPSFFRFPGGNNLEGQTLAQRWVWNNTLGPLTDRPGRVGDWGYVNTDGLGILEYLTWIEDMGMQPIMAVWAGYALNGQSIASNGLAPYIQAARDQIDFVIGDPATNAMAAKRAALGRQKPFTLNFVEVGNEDFFSSTYTYRWQQFVGNLSTEYPQIKFIATSNTFNPPLTPNPQAWDIHVYQTPQWFAQNAFFYDDFQRNGTIYFEGEYAAISTNSSNIFGSPAQGRLTFPTMQSAAGEAAFMTGFERNADIVFAASYAPLLGSVDNNQWTPNLVGFNANSIIRSTSYYVQQLFSLNRGDEYLPSTLPNRNGLTFWSITRRTSTNEILIKISNTDTASSTLTFQLPFRTVNRTGTATVLTGPATTSNTPQAPNTIVPKTSNINVGKSFSFTAPPVSVSVLKLVAHN